MIYSQMREARPQAGRNDLIGCDALHPAQPPKDAIEARRWANDAARRSCPNDSE